MEFTDVFISISFSKLSEQKIYPKDEVNCMKIIDNKIFYLDNTKAIHYLK